MDYEDLLELVKKRRSVRRFKPDPIPDEYIDRIIEVARWAPSGFNLQPWEFVVVKDKSLREQITQLVIDYRRHHYPRMEATRESWQGGTWRPGPSEPDDYTVAPVLILLFGDKRTYAGLPMEVRYNYEKGQSIFTSGLANAFLYMTLAATTLGLASMWISGVKDPMTHCLVKDLLGIPEDLEVYDMVALGYPDSKPRPKFVRQREEMIHVDNCGKDAFRSDEKVKDFIKRTRNWVLATFKH